MQSDLKETTTTRHLKFELKSALGAEFDWAFQRCLKEASSSFFVSCEQRFTMEESFFISSSESLANMELMSQVQFCWVQDKQKLVLESAQARATLVKEVGDGPKVNPISLQKGSSRILTSSAVEWDESASNYSTVKIYAFSDKEVTLYFPKLVNPENFSLDDGFTHHWVSLFEVEYENNQADFLSYLAGRSNDMVYPEAPGLKTTYDNENGQFSTKYNEDSSDFLADRVWLSFNGYHIHLVKDQYGNALGYKAQFS